MDPPTYNNLQNCFDKIESANRKILNYGWVNFPLAYTQVATISVNLYFLAALFGRQYLIPKTNNGNLNFDESELFPDLLIPYSTKIPYESHTPDLFIPFFTLVELFCYVGWIKVAEMLLNPFGEDDEDFQINLSMNHIYFLRNPLEFIPIILLYSGYQIPSFKFITKTCSKYFSFILFIFR